MLRTEDDRIADCTSGKKAAGTKQSIVHCSRRVSGQSWAIREKRNDGADDDDEGEEDEEEEERSVGKERTKVLELIISLID